MLNPKPRDPGRCSAGFQTCCIADFQIGRASDFATVRGFGNPRYSRLGGLRYVLVLGQQTLTSAATH